MITTFYVKPPCSSFGALDEVKVNHFRSQCLFKLALLSTWSGFQLLLLGTGLKIN